MGLYKIPKIIGKDNKPSFGARINWHHPLSQGLVGAWLFNEGGGPEVINVVNKSLHSIVTETGYPTWCAEGIDFDNDATKERYINLTNPSNYLCLKEFSIFFCVFPYDVSVGASLFNTIIANRDGELNDINYEIKIGTTYVPENGDFFSFHYRVGASWHIWTTSPTVTFSEFTWNTFGFSFRYGDPTSTNLVVNGGIVSGTWKLGDGTGLPNTNSHPVRIGSSNETNPNNFIGLMRCVYLYNKAFSTSELTSLHANPYQMFEWMVGDYYFVPAAAPPPTGGKSIFGYDSIFHAGGIFQT